MFVAQTQLEIEKALAEDPTVFDYDGVYEDMQSKKEDLKVKASGGRKQDKAVSSCFPQRQFLALK